MLALYFAQAKVILHEQEQFVVIISNADKLHLMLLLFNPIPITTM